MTPFVIRALILAAPFAAAAEDAMITKAHSVQYSILDVIVENVEPYETNIFSSVKKTNKALTEVLEKLAVPMPDGSSVVWSHVDSTLIMYNTPAAHHILSKMLVGLNIVPSQIESTIRVFQVDDSTLNTQHSQVSLSNIQTNKPSMLLSVVSRSGVCAKSAVNGNTMELTPTVGPDGRTIDVSINMVLHCNLIESEFNSNVVLESGETIILQAFESNGISHLVCFTADIVTACGEKVDFEWFWRRIDNTSNKRVGDTAESPGDSSAALQP